ncbi:MAG: UDP-N-acetylmuramoyl-tripeptide--D-alanyl-D-alanine ligase [Chitinispirillaceae bacterium]|nr:UDP-N-acetylmuramoyl-tripeptide--D-alanyl-D-alanine ligase [Chitinispirillaceae bacterium]
MHKCVDTRHTRLTLGNIAAWTGGTTRLGRRALSYGVSTVRNDSRTVTPGDVFVAIRTDKNDGHRFVADAFAAGASAAIVQKNVRIACAPADERKLIAVADPLTAVQKAAARYRRELGLLVVGITGSSGKTTTRSFIAAVLKTAYAVGETWSNWNNHLGVPQSILRFTGEELVGVIEMGANHAGEISALSKIARPDIGLITNIGYAHVGLFGSLAATTRAKFEIVDGLAGDGFLLLNGDDPRVVAHARTLTVPAVFFGLSRTCGVRARRVSVDPKDVVSFTVDNQEFKLRMPGRHFIYSALPAIALGRRCGVSDTLIERALEAQRPVEMRGTLVSAKGVRFIVDCYNANPSSMKSAIGLQTEVAGKKRKVAVVGDMLELGVYGKRLHRELGRTLAKNGIRNIVAVGVYAREVAEGAVQAGVNARAIATAATADDAAGAVKKVIKPGDVVLLKGSRGVHLETLMERLLK